MKKRLLLILTQIFIFPMILFAFILTGCGSPAMKYIGHRISPDKTSIKGQETLHLDGIKSPVVIHFDKFGVPHIEADDEESMIYAIGYMHGRDRRFQLETLRLLAAGKMRELIGDKDSSGVMTNLEVFSRMIGLEKDAGIILASCDEKDMVVFDAYAAGINAATAVEPRPLEFKLLDYAPAPWTNKDSALIAALISFGLCKNWEHELGRLELIVHQLDTGSTIGRALKIWKPRYYLPPHLIGKKPKDDPFASYHPVAPELVEYLNGWIKSNPISLNNERKTASVSVHDQYWESWRMGGSRSNNWAMSGKWTGTGKGAYSSDPHMPHSLPPLGYLLHVKCHNIRDREVNLIGASFIGMPAVIFGTNGKVAWGPTSNWGDVTDLYVEKPAQGKPGYYLYKGEERAFKIRKEIFKIRQEDGSYKIEQRTVRESVHGVLLNDFIERLPKNFPLTAISRVGPKGRPLTSIRNLYLSQNVTQARAALADFAAMVQHWSLADSSGNIAYAGPMVLPKRTKHLGTIPSPGWTGEYDWKEFFKVEDLPFLENPETGFLGTANNQVIQPDYLGYPVNFEGNVAHRWARIRQVLAKGNDGRPVVKQIAALQIDGMNIGYSEVLENYSPALEKLVGDENSLVSKGAKILLEWDGNMNSTSMGATLFNSLNAYLIKAVLEDEVSSKTMTWYLKYFNAEPFLFGILKDGKNPAWDDRRTEKIETSDEVIEGAFREAIDALASRYGENVENWQWQEAAPFFMNHPFGGRKSLAKYVNRGPFPTPGGIDTVFKCQFMRTEMTRFPIKYGPVLRVMIDFNDLAGSRMSLPGGQSGRPSSKHYDDQIDMFLTGAGISMEMDFEKLKPEFVGTLTILPKE